MPSSSVGLLLIHKLRRHAFIHRLPALFPRHALVLSASEVASLYPFPTGGNTQTDNLAAALSRTLSAPISLKQGKSSMWLSDRMKSMVSMPSLKTNHFNLPLLQHGIPAARR